MSNATEANRVEALPEFAQRAVEDVQARYVESVLAGENSYVAISLITLAAKDRAQIRTFMAHHSGASETWDSLRVPSREHTEPPVQKIANLFELIETDPTVASELIASELATDHTDNAWFAALIYGAEDVQFAEDVRQDVCGRLLRSAQQFLQSRDPKLVPVTKSALRRAISLFRDDDFGDLLPFLDRSGCYVDVRLTVVKAIARAFSNHPPKDDLRQLSDRVGELAAKLLDPDVLEGNEIGAIALNAVHATAVLGGDRLPHLLEQVSGLRKPWLARQVKQRLSATISSWGQSAEHAENVAFVRNALSNLTA